MRHLFVTNDFPPKMGGIESYVTNLCSGLDPDDIAVIAPAREGYKDVDAELDYEVVRLYGSYMRGSRNVHQSIVDVIRRLDVDVVHFLAALPLGRLGPRLRKQTGVPFTVIAHGTGEILLPSRIPFARQLLKWVLQRADVVFPVSEFTWAAVDKLTKGRANLELLPPSVDIDRFSLDVSGAAVRTEHDLGSRFVVLFLSRLVKRKGCDVLIRAVAETKDAVALIGGEGPEGASLQRLARELDVTDRVIFLGSVPEDRLPEHYAAADAFCMPCSDRFGGLDTEGFGVVYLEAQATGLPCIAGRCGGSAEAVEDGITGYVIDEPTPADVAAALKELQEDPALAVKLGGAGRERIERGFSPQTAVGRLEEAIEQITG